MTDCQNRIQKHFHIVAAAAASLAIQGQNAQAAVVYSGVVNISIPSTVAGVYVNIVTGQTATIGVTVTGWDVNPWGASSLDMFSPASIPSGAYVGSGSTYTNVPSMTLISNASTFASGFNSTPDGTMNLNGSNNLIGFRFFNESAATYHFGWMRIALGSSLNAVGRSIVDYAWESIGGIVTPFGDAPPVGILAGDTGIPGPGALAVLGLAGTCAARRRRG